MGPSMVKHLVELSALVIFVELIVMRDFVTTDRTGLRSRTRTPTSSTVTTITTTATVRRPFFNQLQTYDAVNGTRVELSCHIELKLSASDFTNVSWLKMPRRILTRGPLRVTRDNRIHLLPQTVMNTSEFPLIIDPVREQDAGEYRCLFQLGSELHHKVVILVVKVPPYFEQRPAKLVKADERGNLRLFCNASGAPQPKIRWWVRLSLPPTHEPLISSTPEGNRSGTTRVSSPANDENSLLVGKERLRPIEIMLSRYRNDIFVRGGLLVFSRLNRHMSGWYLCEADNGISPAALSLSRVLVRYPPEIRMSNSEIQQHLGGSTIIGCTVRAYPAGSVEWELNGVPIQAPYCGYFEVKKLKYCQIEYHKYAGDFSSLVDSSPNSRVNTVGSFYTGADNILPRRMDPDDHEFYRLSDVRLTIANITHSDLGLYTCRVRTSAGVGEGYTRLDAHPQIYSMSSLFPGISQNPFGPDQLTTSLKTQMAGKVNRPVGRELDKNQQASVSGFDPSSISSHPVFETGHALVTPVYRTKSVKSTLRSSSTVLAYTSPRDGGTALPPTSILVQLYIFFLLRILLLLDQFNFVGI